jgi:hydroxyacylglutathione hydrolase
MFFRMIYDDKLAQAAYLIGCQRTGEAIVIDPERDIDRYLNLAQSEKLRIVAVAETHIHADFLSGARELAEKTGAKVYVSDEGDADWKYQWLNKKAGGGSYNHQLLHHGDTFKVGNIVFTVQHTPGHTPEHITFTVTDTGGGANEPMGVITGDFVFVGDLGRPDLLESAAGVAGVKEASAKMLFKSAQQFLKLPEYLQVWPAHGAGSACGKALGAVPQTTVGYEKRFNPSLRAASGGDEATFVNGILEGQPEPPMYFATMKRLNRDGPPILGALPRPKELSAADLAKIDAKKIAVLDTRPWAKFRAGHLAGALHAPLTNQFPTVAGSFVKENEQIVLVCEAVQLDEAVRCLIRIGLDHITGFATPATLDAAAAQGPAAKIIQTREIDASEFIREMQDVNAFVLDVRRAAEYEAGHVPGSLNIAHTRLLGHLGEVPNGRALLVHCAGGVRSAMASSLLERHGFTPTNIAGGFMAYEKAGGEVVREMAGVA